MKSLYLVCKIYIAFHFILFGNILIAQNSIPIFGNQTVLSGYKQDISGEVITYYSSSPIFAKDALLTRCTDGQKTISWKSTGLPEVLDNEYYYFYWLSGHSSGTSKSNRKFELSINDKHYISFVTPSKKSPPYIWSFSGEDSVSIVFSALKTDVHNDLFGDTYLRVPRKILKPNEPIKISITGNAENSNDWFMVFRYPYTEKIIVTPEPFLIKTSKGIKQIIQIYIDHIYPEIKSVSVKINETYFDYPINAGYNELEIPVDTVKEKTKIKLEIRIGNKEVRKIEIFQYPVSRREVNIIHHSHNDIGYSHYQDEVMQIQYNNILNALDMIDKTKEYPLGSRFVWNEETLWPVEYFLTKASENNKSRFINAVNNKQIALTGFFVGVMTGLCSPEELMWINEYAGILKTKYHFQINTAMLSDIPGLSWSITDALISDGIKYLSNGPNYIPTFPDKGDRIGSIYKYHGDKPFYWKTTDGKDKLLVWTAGCGYSAFHQIPVPELGNKIKEKLISYLIELDTTQYPYNMVQLRYTIKSDNGPLDTNLCDFVRKWNNTYVSPKLVIANVNEMMSKFENAYSHVIPVLSGDFTPYWEDGAYSTAAEEGENRILSDKVLQLTKLNNIIPGKNIDPDWFYNARKNIVMFHEHTWGAWNSISSPDDTFAINQWEYKRSFIDSSKKYIQKIESVLIPETNKNSLTIYNTLPITRNGYIETKLPENISGNALIDEKGQVFLFQKLSNGNIGFIAKDIPPMGFKKFNVTFSGKKEVLPNDVFKIQIDSTTGAIKSLICFNKEWVSATENSGLNQALYITGFDPKDCSTTLKKEIRFIENGPIVKTIQITSQLKGTSQVTSYIHLFKDMNYIKFSCIIDKTSIREKESIHIVFPFNIDNPINRIGISDTFYIPDQGQLKGSNKDFYSVQRWLDISNNHEGITISSPQVALFELGKITDERPLNKGVRKWKDYSEISSTVFLYALNNYWNTNFKADQQGIIPFDCYVLFHKSFDLNSSNEFGQEVHSPLIPVWE